MVKLTEDMVCARSKGSELHNIKKLNCWGSELTDVSVVRKLPIVEVLSLSVNQISTLQDFQHCNNLQELYIRKNNIEDINEVLYLRNLPKLKSLWLNDNPCADFKEYRLTVLRALPHLQKLDNVIVEPEEVQKALVCGLTLPLPNSNFSGEQPSIPRSNSIGDSLKSESSSDASPINSQQVPQGNDYHHSLEEGYEFTQNLYDEDEEQPPLRRSSHATSKQDDSHERRTPQQAYNSQGRSRCSDAYRHTYADYEEDQSSNGSTMQYSVPSRRQSYSGYQSNRAQQHPRQSPPRRISQPAHPAEQERHADSPRSYSRASTEYVPDAHNANYPNRDDYYSSRKPPRDSYREHSWASDADYYPRNEGGPPRGDGSNYRRNETYGSHYLEGGASDYRSPSAEIRPYSSRGNAMGEVLQQHYDNTYRRVDQQIEAASNRGSNIERPSPTRPYPIRPKTRNANVLSAVLCLVKELDYSSLEVVEMAIRCRMEEMDD